MPETSAAPRHDSRLGLVLVACSIGAVATTRLTVHIAPSAMVLVVAAVALGAGVRSSLSHVTQRFASPARRTAAVTAR
jgi:hypothetical protein